MKKSLYIWDESAIVSISKIEMLKKVGFLGMNGEILCFL